MPVPLIVEVFSRGLPNSSTLYTLLKTIPCLLLLAALKYYFGGARNTSERNMHSKVVMMTGATSGIGAAVARQLALRGAQLILLTRYSLKDAFLADYIEDLRADTNNELITAEQVDLASLHSIRTFATKWIDNAPPRRLDLLILCADTMTPKGAVVETSHDGVEATFAVNYLANFHLLSILAPALRAQPADRDVRVLLGTCSSYMGGQVAEAVPVPRIPQKPTTASSKGSKARQSAHEPRARNPTAAYASSKLSLMAFARAFQKHLSAYKRPDGADMNAKVLMVDPGWTRTPGMRRFLSWGSLWGLGFYLILWPVWWLVLKSAEQGAQGFLFGAMEEGFRVGGKRADGAGGDGGKGGGDPFLLKECKTVVVGGRMEEVVGDEDVQKRLWEMSEKAIETLEKEGAKKRASEKAEVEEEKRREARRANEGVKQPGSRRSKKEEKEVGKSK